MTGQTASARIGIDIGGTFTDLVLVCSDGRAARRKVGSTPDDYANAIIEGITLLLADCGIRPEEVRDVVAHGTTVATNAILEGKGARTALVTTEGFKDVLELRRIRVPELYNLFYERPPALVPRRWRFEVKERIGPLGEVWTPLDGRSLEQTLERIKRADVEAVAVCLLHSYANPEHEQQVTEALREQLPKLYVTPSIEVLPEIREYERTSTTVVNAYIGPQISRYLSSLSERLQAMGIYAPLMIMQCNGSVMTLGMAMALPAHLVESGPAAGVKGAAQLARQLGCPNAITLDMGGTSAKASSIEDGAIQLTSDYEVGGGINVSSLLVRGGGYALKVPAIDLSEIGAGGGSVVWIDRGGRLQVGPQSAGAVPGPVCYQAGGTSPTVTDAIAVLGYLNPGYLAGGAVALNVELAETLLREKIAEPLGMSVLETAYGVYSVASVNMVRAVKAVSTFRGRDPRDAILVAFGGNGPVCAAEMARTLQMRQILIPPIAGLFSALGLLTSGLQLQRSRTYICTAVPEAAGALELRYVELERSVMATMQENGYEVSRLSLMRSADMRYADQGYELTVSVGDAGKAIDVKKLVKDFEQQHLRTYGHAANDEVVDVVNIRVSARVQDSEGDIVDSGTKLAAIASASEVRASHSDRQAYFGPELGILMTPVISREDLDSDAAEGPIIIEEYDSTCVVPPDFDVWRDDCGNIRLDRRRD
jgi:N-methylhydantoinase A